jgi:hypothetical protein
MEQDMKLTSEEFHPQALVGAELAVCGACNHILLRLEVTHQVGCAASWPPTPRKVHGVRRRYREKKKKKLINYV